MRGGKKDQCDLCQFTRIVRESHTLVWRSSSSEWGWFLEKIVIIILLFLMASVSNNLDNFGDLYSLKCSSQADLNCSSLEIRNFVIFRQVSHLCRESVEQHIILTNYGWFSESCVKGSKRSPGVQCHRLLLNVLHRFHSFPIECFLV